mgnify:FL=1
MTEEAIGHELDERLLENMPEKKLLIMAVQQQNYNYKVLKKSIDGYQAQCQTCRGEMAGLKGEWGWMKRIVAGGFLVVIVRFIIQAVWGK